MPFLMRTNRDLVLMPLMRITSSLGCSIFATVKTERDMAVNSVPPVRSISDIIDELCPTYGQRAKSVPLFDAQKHAYLVDQYLYPSGNRSLTYVSVCDNMLMEFVLGHHYCMEYINSLRLLVPDGKHFKMVQSYKWRMKTHFSNEELHDKAADMLSAYVRDNAGGVRIDEDELDAEVKKIVEGLFSMTPDYLADGGWQVMEAYCNDAKVCGDFSILIPEWEEE